MILQKDNYGCGAISIVNALEALGAHVDIKDVKKLAGTNYREGTSQRGVIRAIVSLGYKATPYYTNNPDNAWKWIKKYSPTYPLIALVDSNLHWVVISGSLNGSVILVDGSPEYGENGVSVAGKQDVLSRLYHRGHYYAIRVSRI